MNIIDRIFNKRVIIGIHGLANKPPEKLLKKWWKMSIREGLATIGRKETPFTFRLVYWADFTHELPENPRIRDKESKLYLADPYTPGKPGSYDNFMPNRIKKKLLDKLEKKVDKIFFEERSFIDFDKIADLVIRNLFKDLDFYYHRECQVRRFKGRKAKDAIRARLADQLRKYRNREILLIAHSMGTIIAYDVLTQTAPDVPIDTFITVGSPLGFPVVRKKIFMEQGSDFQKDKPTPSPENIVHKWYNFSDLDDTIALNYNIGDDFQKNSRGIGPEDVIVYNNFECNGEKDSHKVYGYLRAPEVAKVIYEFCTIKKPIGLKDIKSWIGGIPRFK